MARASDGPAVLVLQYLADRNRPSWVRVISAQAMRAIGVAEFCLGVFLASMVVVEQMWWSGSAPWYGALRGDWRYLMAPVLEPLVGSPYYSWSPRAALLWLISTPGIMLALLLVTMGVVSIVVAPGIRRGRPTSAQLGVACVMPGLAVVLGTAAFYLAIALVYLVRAWHYDNPVLGLFLFPGLGLPVLALLMVDLLACLRWIARTPLEEMPRRKFV